MTRKTWFRTLPALALIAGGLMLIPARAQSSSVVNLSVNVPTTGELTITAGSAITLTQTGDTFTQPWTSSSPTQVLFSYRASKSSGNVTLNVQATNFVGSDANVPPLSNLSIQATAGTISSGTLTTAAIPLATSPTTLFSNGAGTHAAAQSFSVQYTLAAGDYAADTYTSKVTYTLAWL
ncbi:MAG: hypothetical protein ACRD2H_07990 [Terriglobales bacterium]